MKILGLILSILFASVISGGVFAFSYYPEDLLWILAGILAATLMFSFILIWPEFKAKIFNIIIPFFLELSFLGLVFFIQGGKNGEVRYALIAINFALLFYYFYFVLCREVLHFKQMIGFLYAVVISFFFLYSYLSLSEFFKFSMWISLPVIFAMFMLLSLSFMFFKKSFAKRFLYAIILGLIMVEAFWVLAFWPHGTLINSFVLTVLFYFFGGLSFEWLRDNLTQPRLIQFGSVAAIALLGVLLTAKWFPQ